MKYFKNKTGEVYAYETEAERQEWGASDLTQMSEEEVRAHLNPPMEKLVPQEVSRAQGKVALIQAGLWQGVLDYVAGIEDDTQRAVAGVALDDTTHWRRDSPTLQAISEALGITEEQMDGLFIQASETQL